MAMRRWMGHRSSAAVAVAAVAVLAAACGGGGSSAKKQADTTAKATLQFSQWWAAELPKGTMETMVSDFEKANPNITIKLVTNPYQNTHDSTIAEAATHNMSDVVAMDGTWYSDLQAQGALANLSELMKAANYSDSTLAGELKTDGSVYMIPAVNFVYPMFVNLDLLHKAGITSIPKTQTEFKAAADAISKKTKAKGFTLALSRRPPMVSPTMSWRGCGRPAARCSRTARPTSTTPVSRTDCSSSTASIRPGTSFPDR